MPVIRYHDVSEVPPAALCDADVSPAEGLRMACELSSVALRLAADPTRPAARVQRRRSTSSSFDPAPTTDRERQDIRELDGTVAWDGDLGESRRGRQ